MKITAATVVKNESFILAKHLCNLADISDEVVCFVQPSSDGTELIAKSMVGQLDVPLKVVPHIPRIIVPEDSLNLLPGVASNEWVMYLSADESYQGEDLHDLADKTISMGKKGMGFPRMHAILANNNEFMKVENWPIRRRLFHVSMVGKANFAVHGWTMTQQLKDVSVDVDKSVGRILEYKSAWQHYRRQLWWEVTAGAGSDRARCELSMDEHDLQIGALMWKKEHDETNICQATNTP